jgi:hypothetical protein
VARSCRRWWPVAGHASEIDHRSVALFIFPHSTSRHAASGVDQHSHHPNFPFHPTSF